MSDDEIQEIIMNTIDGYFHDVQTGHEDSHCMADSILFELKRNGVLK